MNHNKYFTGHMMLHTYLHLSYSDVQENCIFSFELPFIAMQFRCVKYYYGISCVLSYGQEHRLSTKSVRRTSDRRASLFCRR